MDNPTGAENAQVQDDAEKTAQKIADRWLGPSVLQEVLVSALHEAEQRGMMRATEAILRLIDIVEVEDRGHGHKSYHIHPVDCIPIIDELAKISGAIERAAKED